MIEETEYSEYVGLKPFSIHEFPVAYFDEEGKATNIPQGKSAGVFLTNDFLETIDVISDDVFIGWKKALGL